MLTKDTKAKIVMHWEDEDGVKRPVAELDNIDLETNDKVLAELDYVRVVRCKDCRFLDKRYDGFGYYFCTKLYQLTHEDSFCSHGERSE